MRCEPLISRPAGPLSGTAAIPADKSISHRALIIGAVAVGETIIDNLLDADDVVATASAVRLLGANVDRLEDDRGGHRWRVVGCGVGGLAEPPAVLDMGNSGTGARLVMGLAASHGFLTLITGDASLSSRPMRRVIEPLSRMGAAFWARRGDRLPLAVRGTSSLLPIDYASPVASAQIKSAILLAALNTPGSTTVIEPAASRDHTERMLTAFGADIVSEATGAGGRCITLAGQPELVGRPIRVPADLSSAAFPLVAASIIPGSRLALPGVGINPLRTGLLETLAEMGADIEIANRREEGGEPVADLIVQSSPLAGVDVPAARVPAMIDEFPILAIAAAAARGSTRMQGLGELRVKESDRLAAVADGLARCGVGVDTGPDWMVVHGVGGPPAGGGCVPVHLDHRIGMAFLVLGMASRSPVRIDDGRPIRTSFPAFVDRMNAIGAAIGPDIAPTAPVASRSDVSRRD